MGMITNSFSKVSLMALMITGCASSHVGNSFERRRSAKSPLRTDSEWTNKVYGKRELKNEGDKNKTKKKITKDTAISASYSQSITGSKKTKASRPSRIPDAKTAAPSFSSSKPTIWSNRKPSLSPSVKITTNATMVSLLNKISLIPSVSPSEGTDKGLNHSGNFSDILPPMSLAPTASTRFTWPSKNPSITPSVKSIMNSTVPSEGNNKGSNHSGTFSEILPPMSLAPTSAATLTFPSKNPSLSPLVNVIVDATVPSLLNPSLSPTTNESKFMVEFSIVPKDGAFETDSLIEENSYLSTSILKSATDILCQDLHFTILTISSKIDACWGYQYNKRHLLKYANMKHNYDDDTMLLLDAKNALTVIKIMKGPKYRWMVIGIEYKILNTGKAAGSIENLEHICQKTLNARIEDGTLGEMMTSDLKGVSKTGNERQAIHHFIQAQHMKHPIDVGLQSMRVIGIVLIVLTTIFVSVCVCCGSIRLKKSHNKVNHDHHGGLNTDAGVLKILNASLPKKDNDKTIDTHINLSVEDLPKELQIDLQEFFAGKKIIGQCSSSGEIRDQYYDIPKCLQSRRGIGNDKQPLSVETPPNTIPSLT